MSSFEEKNLIIDENLRENNSSICAALEKRAAHIEEKAENLTFYYGENIQVAYSEAFSLKDQNISCIAENKKYVSAVYNGLCQFDRLNYVDSYSSDVLGDIFAADSENIFDSDTVVYLKNPLADVAYNIFSKLLGDPRAVYEETFSDVCEEVYYSRAPYCILPLENSEDGRLASFGNMIRKYELKIVLTCSVESANGKTTRFALLKRELARIQCKAGMADGEYLEIGLNLGDEQKLCEVLQAAGYFGYSLNKIDSLPIYYSEKEYYFDVILKGKGELNKLLSWLELEIPRYEVIGIYTHIKTVRNKRGG